MKSSAFYTVIGLGVILVGAVLWYGLHEHQPKPVSIAGSATSSALANEPSLAGFSIYTNGQYGFSFVYPGTDKTETVFDSQYLLPATWRIHPVTDAEGTPIIAVVGYSTKTDMSYLETEVRVGVSTDPKEIAACEKASSGEVAGEAVSINGVTWKTFALREAAMTQYLSGTSYRIVHDNVCYALEQIETESETSDAVPKEKSDALTTIVQSFNFAKP